jgi:predicted dehydrogenase
MKQHPSKISRRNFLAIGAAAAAGCATRAAVAPPVVSAQAVRIGVIGCGARGQALVAEAMSRVEPDVPIAIAAVSDACAGRRDKIAAATKAASIKRWQNLIERHDIDAVIVATPDNLHAPISIAAMEAGKDVYCERPMALTLADAAAFRDTAARTKRVVQIGAHQTSEAQWHAARELMAGGKLGQLRWCQGRYGKSNELAAQAASSEQPDWDVYADGKSSDPDRFYNWRKYKDYSGGVAWSDLYWKLAALLVATDTPEQEWPVRVSAAGGVYTNDGREVPDSFVLNAEFASGHTIVLASSMAGNRERPAMIRGEQAAIEFNGDSIAIIGDGGYGESEQVTVPARKSHLDNWLGCIRSRDKCVCDERLGYRTSAIIAMAMQAYATGTSVAMDGASGAIVTAPARV